MAQSNSKRGMYTLNEDVDMEAKMTALARRLEELKSRGAHEVKVVNDVSMKIVQYSICQSTKHLVSECSIILAIREIFVEQANTIRFLSNLTILHSQIPSTSSRRIIQTNLAKVDKVNSLLTCKLLNIKLASLVDQVIVNLSKVMGDLIRNQKNIISKLNKPC